MTSSEKDERKESVRSAWTRAVRQEALRVRRTEVSRITHVGVIIATYANADGTNATMSLPTLAAITGYSQETVTRAVRVLVAVGLLDRRRRPNATPVHTLLMPLADIEWDTHLYLYTDTRQRARRQRIKQEEARRLADPSPTEASGTPGGNGFRTAFPPGVPDCVPAGGSGLRSRRGFRDSGTRSRTVPEPVPGRGPEPVPAGGVHRVLPPEGNPQQDTDVVGPEPQPQVRAREAEPPARPGTPPGLQALAGGGRAPGGQPPLLLPVPEPAPLDHALIAAHMTALYDAPVPLRRAAQAAVEILGDLDVPDPTAHVIGALDADPGRYRPPLPPHGRTATRRRPTGT